MGFKLKSLGRNLAGSVVTFAHGVLDNLENSVVAPPASILLGTAAVLAGAAVVKHLQKRNRNKARAPATDEVRLFSARRSCSYTLDDCLAEKIVFADSPKYCRMTAVLDLYPALYALQRQLSTVQGHPPQQAQLPSGHRSHPSGFEVLHHSLDRQLPTVR